MYIFRFSQKKKHHVCKIIKHNIKFGHKIYNCADIQLCMKRPFSVNVQGNECQSHGWNLEAMLEFNIKDPSHATVWIKSEIPYD